MIIYNVTVNVEQEVTQDWYQWMKDIHIPEVMETGFFTHFYFTKVLSRQEDETGTTYAIQYHCKSEEAFDEYQKNHAPRLQQAHTEKFEGKFVAFRTLLEKI